MAFTSEILWELWAWLAVGIMAWGAALLFSRCRNFWRACMPTWYPSEVSYFVILFVMNAVLSTAGALTWALGGWFVYPYALSFTVGTLFLVAVAHFVLFTWYGSAGYDRQAIPRRRQITVISSLVLVVALAVDVAATVFFYYAVSMVAFAFGILYGIYLVALIVMNMVMAWHDTAHARRDGTTGPCGCTKVDDGGKICMTAAMLARRDAKIAAAATPALESSSNGGNSSTVAPGELETLKSEMGAAPLSLPPGMRTSGYALVAKRRW